MRFLRPHCTSVSTLVCLGHAPLRQVSDAVRVRGRTAEHCVIAVVCMLALPEDCTRVAVSILGAVCSRTQDAVKDVRALLDGECACDFSTPRDAVAGALVGYIWRDASLAFAFLLSLVHAC